MAEFIGLFQQMYCPEIQNYNKIIIGNNLAIYQDEKTIIYHIFLLY